MEALWRTCRTFATLILFIQHVLLVAGIELDLEDVEKTKITTKSLARSVMNFYDGNKPGQTPGMLTAVGEFNWWEAGALFGQMVEYWYYTGDDTYNNVTKQALVFQAGPDKNYEPENQTRTEGNDDQAFWAFAAMSAAEMKFPNPDPHEPQWLALAQAVFNRQAARWDDRHCDGGLRWQFNPLNNGWMLKNSISNGCFFQLGARLARYTGNKTYAEWANKTWTWMSKHHLLSDRYEVFDAIGFSENHCDEEPGPVQWTYNIGTMLAGAAFMYNYTNGSPIYRLRIRGLLETMERVFFPNGSKIMIEYACEIPGNCNKDQRSFKAYLARWLAVTTQIAPWTHDRIMPLLHFSAEAAAKVCVKEKINDRDDIGCGRRWNIDKDDGLRDIGQQLTAMSIVQSNLIGKARPLADENSGLSKGDPGAGGTDTNSKGYIEATRPITAGDKAGAWLLTIILLLGSMIGAASLVADGDLREYTGFLGGNSWGRHSWGR